MIYQRRKKTKQTKSIWYGRLVHLIWFQTEQKRFYINTFYFVVALSSWNERSSEKLVFIFKYHQLYTSKNFEFIDFNDFCVFLFLFHVHTEFYQNKKQDEKKKQIKKIEHVWSKREKEAWPVSCTIKVKIKLIQQ